MIFVEVAVAAPLLHSLTYSLAEPAGIDPAGMDWVGRRVLVPLGRRSLTGYILSVQPVAEVGFTVKAVRSVLDPQPLFPANLIPLFRWIADYYHFPLGEVIRAALPAGTAPRSVRRFELTDLGKAYFQAGHDRGHQEDWLVTLQDRGGLNAADTAELLKSATARKYLTKLEEQGLLSLREDMAGGDAKAKMESCYRLTAIPPWSRPWSDQPEKAELDGYRLALGPGTGPPLKLSAIKTLYCLHRLASTRQLAMVTRQDLLRAYPGAAKALGELQQRGDVVEEKRRLFRSPFGEAFDMVPRPEVLTEEQTDVLQSLRTALVAGTFQPFLLYGVTGSGKTEVYLRAAEETLALGRDVLVLVPEIALATQLEEQFLSRFGEQVVLLHSGLSSAERFDQWSLAMAGQARVVIGARSAIFAPLRQPGLIVVDEEHDAGFKQDDALRYNGRDVAVMRAKLQNAVVLLASATPAVTSYANAVNGKYTLLRLTRRVGDRALPEVHLIDLSKKEAVVRGSLFQPLLTEALTRNLARGKQSVILLNRRGFSTTVLCQDCGTAVECAHCRVSLTLHKARQKLLCHYCGYSVHAQTVCNACGSMTLTPIGFGTERVEEELISLFPEARIARIDTDTASDRRLFLSTLKQMRDGAIDILIGTQMVAKGHHFPNVTLVGVVWADGGLGMPDFRAAEKTFQLITQVTGRAGRGDTAGEVYIQTYRPDHYAIQFAQAHQYELLVERELALRCNPLFPPFVRLVALHIQGEKEEQVRLCAEKIAISCRGIMAEFPSDLALLGPAPAPIERLRNRYRWQVLLKSASGEVLHRICRKIQAERQELAGRCCTIAIDVDPENMM